MLLSNSGPTFANACFTVDPTGAVTGANKRNLVAMQAFVLE